MPPAVCVLLLMKWIIGIATSLQSAHRLCNLTQGGCCTFVLFNQPIKIDSIQSSHIAKHSNMIEVSSDGLLLFQHIRKSIGSDDFLTECRPQHKVTQRQSVLTSLAVNPLTLILSAVDCDCDVSFSHGITLLYFRFIVTFNVPTR